MSRLLDPNFKYVPSHETDVRKTIERAKRQLKAERERAEANKREQDAKVATLPGKVRAG